MCQPTPQATTDFFFNFKTLSTTSYSFFVISYNDVAPVTFLSVIIVTYAGQHDFGTAKFNDVDVNGTIDLSQAHLSIGGDHSVGGDGDFSGTLTVEGAATFASTASVTGDLTVSGEQILNGFITKTYTQTYTNVATNGGVGNSIGPIQGGFASGHVLISGSAQITAANAADIGAITLACATPANAALTGTPANSSTGTLLAASTALGVGGALATPANAAFSGTLTSLCTVGAAANASSGTMIVRARVMAVPGAPALP